MSQRRDGGGSWYLLSGDEECEHDPVVRLGADGGNNEYYHCRECGSVLIREGHADHRHIRDQQRQQQQQSSDNPFASALNLEEMSGWGRQDNARKSSTTEWIRQLRRRFLGK